MDCSSFASGSLLLSLVSPAPSRCPYCPPGTSPHWIGWGAYERYAGERGDPVAKVVVPRYRCKVTRRTFSLPPDGLLPYCGLKTAFVLLLLHALFVRNAALSTLACQEGLARGTLRNLRARFSRVVSVLRLPGREGALGAAAFLQVLVNTAQDAVVSLFRGWKEREPKHAIVGIYAR